MTARVFGKELKVNDTIETWWAPGRDTILSLSPYDGPLNDVFAPDGAQIASFAIGPGMTIEGGALFTLVARPGGMP